MSLLARTEVTPYYAQIQFSARGAKEYPQWETGDEQVVSLPRCIAVATQGDHAGKVAVEVWRDRLEVRDIAMSSAVFDGPFVTTADGAVVGNTVGNEFHPVPLEAGTHRLRVFVSPLGERPKRVYFLVGESTVHARTPAVQ